jgi:hypothetical protein
MSHRLALVIGIVGFSFGVSFGTNVLAQGASTSTPSDTPCCNPSMAAMPANSPIEQSPGEGRAAARVVALDDGGTLLIRGNGTMVHENAAGDRVRMRDGVAMRGKDGARYSMKNDPIWKKITETGTLHPNRP